MNNELKEQGYAVVDAPEIDRQALAESFDRLPTDVYLRSGTRSRRFSWFAGTPQSPVKLPHKLFYQTAKYEGRPDIHREFDEIDASVYNHPSFQNILGCFVRVTDVNMANTPIEVHQIRIRAGGGFDGNASPEGVHRDGCHYLGVFVVDRDGVEGGETSVHLNKTDGPIYSEILPPGHFLFIDDEKVMHHALPMTAKTGKKVVYWDIFVLTAGEHRRKE